MSRRPTGAGRSCAALLRTVALFLFAFPAAVLGTPFLPVDDEVILELVPARSALERLAPLRRAVAARPGDLAAALALAQGYVETGRRYGDPRFVAYAEATLIPWLARANPPEPALVLQATALQYLHQFDRALGLLDQALAAEPRDGQAWLSRASLLELRGNYGEARRACARLIRTADEFVALTCLTSVDGRSGALSASYAALRRLPVSDARLAPAVRSWALAVLADMAERLGEDSAAEADLQAALRSSPDDPFLKASYADLLLRLGRPAAVIELLRVDEAQDALLLRLAIAGKRAGSAEAARWASMCEERFRAAERDRDLTHQREWGMFLLDVQGDARAALMAAINNWQQQREPADLRIYARAAERVSSAPDRNAIAAWVAMSRYEDHAFALPATRAASAP
jgi:tetratricopeptide (TPR) repeat protein